MYSSREAYIAMTVFLDSVFERTQSDDLGSLLGSLSLLKDGSSADPALWHDWLGALAEVRTQSTATPQRALLDLSKDSHN